MSELKTKNGKVLLIQDAVFFCGLLLCVLLLVYKAQRSIGDEDETLFILNAVRLAHGDRLLVDDWHVSQLSAVFLWLPVKLYLGAVGSCEGIVLFSRLLFVGVQTVIAAVTYFIFRKNFRASVIAALLFLFHVPVGYLMVVYYNSLLCVFGQLAVLLIYSLFRRFATFKALLLGMVYAATVISSPYCALLLPVSVILVIIFCQLRKKGKSCPPAAALFSVKMLLYMLGGIFLAAVVFLIVLLQRSSPAEIIKNLPMVFYDSEYSGGVLDGLLNLRKNTGYSISVLHESVSYLTVFPPLLLLLAVAADKKRIKHRTVYLSIMLIWYLFILVIICCSKKIASRFADQYGFLFAAAVCYALTEKKNRTVFFCIFLPGFLLSALRGIESDMFIFAWYAVLPLCITGAVLLVSDTAREMLRTVFISKKTNKKAVRSHRFKIALGVILAVILPLQLALQIYSNMHPDFYPEHQYGTLEDRVLDTEFTRGPFRGIRTSARYAEYFNNIMDDLDTIKEQTPGPVMVPLEVPWVYMYLDELPMGAYSGFLIFDEGKEKNCSQKMQLYYEYHPERYPKYIYQPFYGHFYTDATIPTEALCNNIINCFNCVGKVAKGGYIYVIDSAL